MHPCWYSYQCDYEQLFASSKRIVAGQTTGRQQLERPPAAQVSGALSGSCVNAVIDKVVIVELGELSRLQAERQLTPYNSKQRLGHNHPR